MDNTLEFTLVNVKYLQAISQKLNKIYVASLKCQHQHTTFSFSKIDLINIDLMREIYYLCQYN